MKEQAQRSVRKFNVHLYPVVHVRVDDIEAKSHREAIDKALEQSDLYHDFQNDDAGWAESCDGYLVDVVGDEEYRQTRWFYSDSHEAVRLLRELVPVLQRKLPADAELKPLVEKAAEIVEHSA